MQQQRVVADARPVADATYQAACGTGRSGRGVSPPSRSPRSARRGLLGLTIPAAFGGLGQGLRTMAATLDEVAQRCASTAMVYLMHLCGVACYAAAPDQTEPLLREAAAGRASLARSRSARRDRAAISGRRSAGRQRDGNGAVRLNAEQVVRHLRRPRRRLCGLDARRRRDDSRSRARSISCSATTPASASPGRGAGSACAATPARR